jgi:DNA segregation ATPase FtsK/SpoIIIE, S-DNA-T family
MSRYTIAGVLCTLPETAKITDNFEAHDYRAVLEDLGVRVVDAEVEPGLRVTLVHLQLGRGGRIRELRQVREDLALLLGARSVEVRTGYRDGRVTLEIGHAATEVAPVGLGDVFKVERPSGRVQGVAGMVLPWAAGLYPDGRPMVVDLADAPHVLIGGQTGSGKSSHLHALLLSMVMMNPPSDVELVLVDPKRVDLSLFRTLPHVRRPVITQQDEAMELVTELLAEVEFRYEEFQRAAVTDLLAYNKWASQKSGEDEMQRIVLVIDELAMLLTGKKGGELADRLTELAQVCRAAGLHIVAATQRPSATSLPTQLRSQLTTRLACRVATAADSRMILDSGGAEKLLGAGDSLVRWGGGELQRVQGVFVEKFYRAAVIEALGEIWG